MAVPRLEEAFIYEVVARTPANTLVMSNTLIPAKGRLDVSALVAALAMPRPGRVLGQLHRGR
jgi:hypothetical protein